PDTVITSFPTRVGMKPSVVDDLQKQILEDINRDPFRSTGDLVVQILTACCKTLSPDQDVESVKFLQFFESSIAAVVSASCSFITPTAKLLGTAGRKVNAALPRIPHLVEDSTILG